MNFLNFLVPNTDPSPSKAPYKLLVLSPSTPSLSDRTDPCKLRCKTELGKMAADACGGVSSFTGSLGKACRRV